MDEKYINIAIKEALKSLKTKDVPVGAVIVKNGKVIAKTHNRKESKQIATYHAEVLAIEKACRKLKNWRLNNCVIYVTLEPCKMCMGAIEDSRIERLVYGTINPKKVNSKLKITSKIKEEECKTIISKFFKNKRK